MATIYIVDDRPINRQFLVTLLGYSGHVLAEAADGAEALDLVQRQIPDLIILDIVMPKMDGIEFVSRLRADPATSGVPVIFYTATYRNEEAHNIARACGVRWVLPKPSDPQAILKVVAQALGEDLQQDPTAAPFCAMAANFQLSKGESDLKERMTRLSNETLRQQDNAGETADAGDRCSELQLIQMQAMTLKLVALVEAGIDIGAVRDPAKLVELYCRATQDILTAKYAAIRIIDQQGETRYLSVNGMEEQDASRLEWSALSSGAFAHAVEERRPVRINGADAAARAGLPAGHPPVQSIIVVPLLSPEQSYGWLYVADRLGFDGFCMDDERIAVTIGAQFSLAFENIELCDRVQLHANQLQRESLERLQAVESLRQKEQMLIHQSRQAAMGEMINNIAHQWRQPLNTLGLMIQHVSLICQKEPNADQVDDIVHKAMQLISHMSQTIDDFRNFFRPDKEMVLFKVNQVLASSISLIEGSFNEIGVTLETATQGDLLIFGYPNEYAQVLLNILGNARDALSERRVAAPRVTISSFSADGNAVVTIRDNAGGIPAEVMPRIFEPYFTTKGKETGTGVGLFMSRTIIEKNMQGTLSAENTEEGVEFRIAVRTAMAPYLGQNYTHGNS